MTLVREVYGGKRLKMTKVGNGEQVFGEQWFVVVSRLPVALTLLLCMCGAVHVWKERSHSARMLRPFCLFCVFKNNLDSYTPLH